MNPTTHAESTKLGHVSTAFVLAAAITVVFNTALAWAKDLCEPLNSFMKSVSGHHWTTHGLADVILFIALGLIFLKTNLAEKIDPNRLISILVWAVVAASVGLFAWFLFF
jgi:uncharacterized membrane protein SirB2